MSKKSVPVSDYVAVPLRSAYDGMEDIVSAETGLSCPEDTLTQQQFVDDCNPNVILERFMRTGEMEAFAAANPQYGDFTGEHDYQSALNIVIAANDAFAALPAAIRKRFDNDPALFVEFAGDPANREEMFDLGLLSPDAKRNPSFAGRAAGDGDEVAPSDSSKSS